MLECDKCMDGDKQWCQPAPYPPECNFTPWRKDWTMRQIMLHDEWMKKGSVDIDCPYCKRPGYRQREQDRRLRGQEFTQLIYDEVHSER